MRFGGEQDSEESRVESEPHIYKCPCSSKNKVYLIKSLTAVQVPEQWRQARIVTDHLPRSSALSCSDWHRSFEKMNTYYFLLICWEFHTCINCILITFSCYSSTLFLAGQLPTPPSFFKNRCKAYRGAEGFPGPRSPKEN